MFPFPGNKEVYEHYDDLANQVTTTGIAYETFPGKFPNLSQIVNETLLSDLLPSQIWSKDSL